MRRRHLIELEDQAWCPAAVRRGITDLLQLFLGLGNCYAAILPRLARALEMSGERDIVDLCSGSGGPWLRLLPYFPKTQLHQVRFTDKYPNATASRDLVANSKGRITVEQESVDATAVKNLPGLRTLFTAFHHFRPDAARAILADAVRERATIAIFEFTERSVFAIILFCFSPIAVLLLAPFCRPFRWTTIFLTYIVPVLPLAAAFDGVVSCLRTYSEAELREMVANLSPGGYIWEIGQERSWRSPVPITFLIGYPRSSAGPVAELGAAPGVALQPVGSLRATISLAAPRRCVWDRWATQSLFRHQGATCTSSEQPQPQSSRLYGC